MASRVVVDDAGTIEVARGDNPRRLYEHQQQAVQQLNAQVIMLNGQPFAGLLVIPTGGGKTMTAVQWLLRNCVDKDKKVLWIAHRHELLEQAKESFQNNAYSDLLKSRRSFNYRIVSGINDKPKDIRTSDDIIIASKDSLRLETATQYLLDWLHASDGDLFLVIDEAHHAIAKTYRKLIDLLRERAGMFRMLGLTATPFRTAQNEQGLLGKLFTDDTVFKIDLRTLINRGILAEPIFEEIQTKFDMTEVFTDEELRKIQVFDISSIGKSAAKTIAENRLRNNRIVERYIRNQDRYGQTLVFALNVDNAIALNALFQEQGVASDYVVAAIYNAFTGVPVSPKENRAKIERFRKGELKVLINVNILTEGTDLPKVQTVFLTRPTVSTILMTQMIGRGLRGEKAGGTPNVYIVSFVDNWKDKIAWVNPETVFIETNTDFNDESPETTSRLIRLISIEKIEEFARVMDVGVDTTELENLDFIQRIPVGLYAFSILKPSEDQEETEKNCDILVYDNIQQAYSDFVYDLLELFKVHGVADKEVLTDAELELLSQSVEAEYFHGCEKLPGYWVEDIKDVLRYYALHETQPQFIEFKDRPNFDVTRVALEIHAGRLGGDAMGDYLNEVWESDETAWRAFFGYDRRYFVNEVMLAYRKLLFPGDFQKASSRPIDIKELRELERLSLSDLREKVPEYWRQLTDKVFARAKDEDGYYTSAQSGIRSKQKIGFQIDHIKPFSKGGLTTLDNLQLLTWRENLLKGNEVSLLSKLSDVPSDLPPVSPGTRTRVQPLTSPRPDEDERLLLFNTRQGFIGRVPCTTDPAAISSLTSRGRDAVTSLLVATPDDTVLFFSDRGRVYAKEASRIPAERVSLTEVIKLGRREKVVAAMAVPGFDQADDLIMLTRRGQVKRIDLFEFERVRPGGRMAISPDVSPALDWVGRVRGRQELILVSRSGQALRFKVDDVPLMGRAAAGVAAMQLQRRDEIAGADVVDPQAALLVVTERGFAKQTPLSEYPSQGRNGKGVRTLASTMEKTGYVVAGHVVSRGDQVVLVSQSGRLQCTPIEKVPQRGRATQGTRVMELEGNDLITAVAIIAPVH